MESAAPSLIVAVGDELVGGFTLDTNSHWLAQQLRDVGWPVRRIEAIGDRTESIVSSVRRALAEASVERILVCGGMGPTPDDRTVEGVAQALELPLVSSPEAVRRVTATVARLHAAGWVDTLSVSAPNLRMTVIPEGAELLENRRGLASPVAIPADDARWLFVLPGVPRELQTIVSEELIPRYFAGRAGGTVVELRFTGIPEALFASAMETLAAEFPTVSVGSYPQPILLEVLIRLRGSDAAEVECAAERMLELAPARAPGARP